MSHRAAMPQDLFSYLHDEGFSLSLAQQLKVQSLFLRLPIEVSGDLAGYLTPILAESATQQSQLHHLLKAYTAQRAEAVTQAQPKAQEIRQSPPSPDKQPDPEKQKADSPQPAASKPQPSSFLPPIDLETDFSPPADFNFHDNSKLIAHDQEFLNVALALRRKTETERLTLDVRRSVHATLKAAGYPRLVYKAVPEAPHYLFLIECYQAHDLFARTLSALAEALQQEGVSLTVLYYQDSPTWVYAPKSAQFYALSSLYQQFSQAVLLVFGHVKTWILPDKFEVKPDLAAGLSQWDRRFVLSPQPVPYWSYPEDIVHQTLPVLPLLDRNPEAEGHISASLHSLAALTDPAWVSQRKSPFRLRAPKAPSYALDQLPDLERWLGKTLVAVLTATSFELRWEVLVALSQALTPKDGEDLARFAPLLTLTQLNWMRTATIPPSLLEDFGKALYQDEKLRMALGKTLNHLATQVFTEAPPKAPPDRSEAAFSLQVLRLFAQAFQNPDDPQAQAALQGLQAKGYLLPNQTSFIPLIAPPKAGDRQVLTIKGVDFAFRYCPPGSFWMGDDDASAWDDEKPAHAVEIQEGFWMGETPVTQAQWVALMGSNPSRFSGENRPVEQVSWEECQAYCAQLNGLGLGVFRLPLEEEWEYACRAGSSTRYYFGDNEKALEDHAWYGANSGGATHPVGEKLPNAWGLRDMHGNVLEWTNSEWTDNYAAFRNRVKQLRYSQVDMQKLTKNSNTSRVFRGGSWGGRPQNLRAANRYNNHPTLRNDFVGFRLAKAL